MLFWSANFGNRELRMVQKTLEICLSETHASGNREVRTKDPSPEAMLIPDAKETMEKEWKEVRKKAHKETISKSTSTSRGMFERAVSSVEIMCFMNLYECDLLFFEESRTNDRFKARDQGQKELYTNCTVLRNFDDDVDGEKQPQPIQHRGDHRGGRWSRKKGGKVGIGTIINKVVDDWHSWKVARMNSKSSSSTSTIIECTRVFYMNFDKSWIMNYGSSLREKEENFDNIFESSKPTVEYHEKGAQDSNNVETKIESSSVHRETVASTMRVNPGLLEKQQRRQQQSLRKYIRGQSPTTEKKRILREDRIWTIILGWQTWRRHSFETLTFQYVYLDTTMKVEREEVRELLRCHTSSIENGEACKIPRLTGKKIHVWGLGALPLPQKLQSKEGELSNSLKIWAKSRILNSFLRNAGKNFGRQSLSHHYAPVCAGRMRCKSCQRKWRRELFAEDNLFPPRKDQK